eukprot:3427779-Prymnesium_polylepis.1
MWRAWRARVGRAWAPIIPRGHAACCAPSHRSQRARGKGPQHRLREARAAAPRRDEASPERICRADDVGDARAHVGHHETLGGAAGRRGRVACGGGRG